MLQSQIIDRFLPDQHGTPSRDALRQTKLVIGLAWVGSTSALIAAAIQWTHGSPMLGVAGVICAVGIGAIPFIVRATGSQALGANMFAAAWFIACGGVALYRGGVGVPALAGCAFTPVFALLLAGLRSSIVWMAISTVLILGISMASRFGIALHDRVPAEERAVIATTMPLVFMVIAFFTAYLYDFLKNAAVRDLAENEKESRALVDALREELARKPVRLTVTPGPAPINTGALAHQLNNPLAYVIANLDLLVHSKALAGAQNGELSEALEDALTGARKIQSIVANLSTGAPKLELGAEATRPADDGLRGRILIIDDDQLVAKSLRRSLHVQDVTVIGNGREALKILRQTTFDLVFCDLMMPDMTGMELYEVLLRERPELSTKFVFMTGGVFSSDVHEFLGRISNSVIEKPFDKKVIQQLMKKALPH